MRVIEREVVARHAPARTPICGFVTYVSDREPVLIRRMGWEVADDVHDEFVDLISRDNGRTWGEPRTSLRNVPLPGGGYTTFTENAALYVPGRDVLLTFTYQKQHASLAAHDGGRSSGKVHITTTHSPAAPGAFEQSRVTVSDFGFRQGLLVSFPTPIIDSRGRVVVPVCNQLVVTDAEFLRSRKIPTREDMPDVPLEAFEDRLLIGEFDGDGEINWHVSGAVPFDLDRTLYLCEGTVAELTSGRFVKVLRGTNRDWPERPGYKWASYSDNAGETWTAAEPWACDDGTVFESSATGSALFRSIKNGKLYWLGNLCVDGRRPNGNMPREPLWIAEVQGEPFALKRSTLFAIDRRREGEDERVQHSNFRFYQDRETGDLILHLTRYGECGHDDLAWMKADHYRYRVELT